MYHVIEFWKSGDSRVTIKFNSYNEAFQFYATKRRSNTLPSIGFFIVDVNTGEILLEHTAERSPK